VFTGLFDLKKPGEYPYMLLEGNTGGEGEISHGKPPPERIRHEIGFEDLPDVARRRVLEIYRGLWGLKN